MEEEKSGGERFCLLIIYYTDTAARPDSAHKESRPQKRGRVKVEWKILTKKLQKVEAKNVKCSRGEKCKNRMNWQRRGSARVRVGGSPGGGAGFGLQQIL